MEKTSINIVIPRQRITNLYIYEKYLEFLSWQQKRIYLIFLCCELVKTTIK